MPETHETRTEAISQKNVMLPENALAIRLRV